MNDSANPHLESQGINENENPAPNSPPYRPISRKSSFEDEAAVSQAWLITFTDIIALMLTFFVLLYSMAKPEVKKWEGITGALNRELGESYAPKFEASPEDTAIYIDKVEFRRALNFGYITTLIKAGLEEKDNADGVVFIESKDHLIVSMPETVLFDAGSIEVQESGKRLLFTLGGILSNIKNKIEIVGHADPQPLSENNDQNIQGNWELSLLRAVSVAGVLKNVGYDKPVTVRGMASARFYDLDESIAEDKRKDLSRRVDIVILKNDGRRRSSFFDW